MRFVWLSCLVLWVAAATACGDDVGCPEGTALEGGRCVPSDASASSDAEVMDDAGGEDDAGWMEDAGEADGGCVPGAWYRDEDGDGYGVSEDTVEGCEPPDGYVADDGDCDDADDRSYPGAPEMCDGIDNDCDGDTDEEVTTSTYYADTDADGYGDSSTSMDACAPPEGYVSEPGDCDDADDAIHPEATEVCNEVDDDCDGTTDEGVQTTFYRDTDEDGYGHPTTTTEACSAPDGYVAGAGDCDDANGAVHPGATEVCNSVDDDCDGMTDEGVRATFYRDDDGDGYGVASMATMACTAPSGYAADAGDCDDTDSEVHPGATEVCNGIDDDCNTMVDEGSIGTTWYTDCDGDGFAPPTATSRRQCTEPAPLAGCSGGWTDRRPLGTSNSDCHDANAFVHPNQTTYYPDPIEGTSDDYDYNCDDDEEERYTATNRTSCPCTPGSILTYGWTGSTIPACGDSAQLRTCGWNLIEGTCINTTATTRQPCR